VNLVEQVVAFGLVCLAWVRNDLRKATPPIVPEGWGVIPEQFSGILLETAQP
jgi:hypothetical protein